MRIAVLSSTHDHLDTRVFHKEARSISGFGHEVILIAPLPEDGFVDGIEIRPVPFGRSRAKRWLHTVPAVYREAVASGADVFHFHSPELIPAARLLKRKGHVIYDAHEDLPLDILSKSWVPRILRRPLSGLAWRLDRWAGRFCDAVIVVQQERSKRFPADRTFVVGNFPTGSDLLVVGDYRSRPPVACYVGDVTSVRGASEMVRAAERLAEIAGFRLVIAGRISTPGLEETLRSEPGWRFVDYRGWQSRSEVAEILRSARVGLLVVRPDPNLSSALPHKLFEYMAAGIPVVASDFPLWREVVESAGCGVLVDPTDDHAIADAVRDLLDDVERAEEMGRNGRAAVETTYSWSSEEETLRTLYGLLESSARPSNRR